MEHLIKQNPTHVTLRDGTPLLHLPDVQEKLEYRQGLQIPYFLNFDKGTCTAILPSDLVLEPGDVLHSEYPGWKATVTEIIDRRKARGTWEKNPYDVRPDWVRIRFI